MKMATLFRGSSLLLTLASAGTLLGCAHYEVNNNRGNIPGFYIRSEMQESDRAVEAARAAGKDQTCPEEFKQAEDAKNKAYDVFRACHTEEGAALAKKATAKANALCPPAKASTFVPAATPAPVPATAEAAQETVIEVLPAAEPAPGHYKYCMMLHGEFDINRAEIRPEYRDEVGRVGNFMKKYPTTTAVIEGHSDDVGNDRDNMELSRRRAEAVVNYLVENYGIDRSRLAARGYGKVSPEFANSSDLGRQKNRRIEAIIDCVFEAKEIALPERLCMSLVVDFDNGKQDIKPQYRDEIAKVGEFLKKYPSTTAVIEGHTDNVGGNDYNMKLSLERAQAVVNYLVQNFGIDRSRLAAKGFGSSRRIAYNNTAEGRAANRRINAIVDCVLK
jgi:OmpA-OmpF porin, OOP family